MIVCLLLEEKVTLLSLVNLKKNVREKDRSTCLDINHHSSFDVIQNEINKQMY